MFARTGEAAGARGIRAFVVDAGTPGLEIAARIEVIAPHPLASLRFRGCRVSASQRLGEPGQGFKVAMRKLDIFRASVAAAALGFARRALDEALARAKGRKMFGQTLADFQLTQAAIADMATAIDSAALLTYRAAWLRDVKGARTTREAAMAKMVATEVGAAGDRPRGADVRRPRRGERLPGGKTLPRDSRRCAFTKARPKCRS